MNIKQDNDKIKIQVYDIENMNDLGIIAIIDQPEYIKTIKGSDVDKVFNETWLDEIRNDGLVLLSSNLNIEMLWQISNPRITVFTAKLVHVRVNRFVIQDVPYHCTIPGILSTYKEFCKDSALITQMNNDPSFLVKDFLNKIFLTKVYGFKDKVK